jgi:hypothetical protein
MRSRPRSRKWILRAGEGAGNGYPERKWINTINRNFSFLLRIIHLRNNVEREEQAYADFFILLCQAAINKPL